jgi:hypothetical protein
MSAASRCRLATASWYAHRWPLLPLYVITEALKVLFKRDVEFKAWLGQHANGQNSEQVQEEGLTKTA